MELIPVSTLLKTYRKNNPKKQNLQQTIAQLREEKQMIFIGLQSVDGEENLNE